MPVASSSTGCGVPDVRWAVPFPVSVEFAFGLEFGPNCHSDPALGIGLGCFPAVSRFDLDAALSLLSSGFFEEEFPTGSPERNDFICQPRASPRRSIREG